MKLDYFNTLKNYTACAFVLLGTTYAYARQNETQYAAQADAIHKKYITLDSHNDSALWFNHPNGDFGVTKGQVSFPMMKKGGLDAAFFAIYLEQGKRDAASLDSVFNHACQEIAMFKKYISDRSSDAEFAYTPNDLSTIKAAGKSAVILAIENGYGIGDKLERIDEFYKMGARYITLSHNGNNNICDASMSEAGPEHNGLSPFGRQVIERMNQLGMMIDISHASSKTVADVLECSKAPVIASHSGAWAIKNHKRNLKDGELKAIADKGGVIQVATGRFFLSTLPKKEVTIKHLADHIDHIVSIVGIEHVGLGTDFDGGGGVVGLENVSKMKSLTIELLKRGYTSEQLGLFWGGNLLRVWQIVQQDNSGK
ncbi:MAG: dipeptidase [Bacteroidales bacterium]